MIDVNALEYAVTPRRNEGGMLPQVPETIVDFRDAVAQSVRASTAGSCKLPKPCRQTPGRFLEALKLDVKSVPGLFMSQERNAKWHLDYGCPHCSDHRRSFRDPKKGGSDCMWKRVWEQGHFDYPRSFGAKIWALYYLGIKADLDKFREAFERCMGDDDSDHGANRGEMQN